MQLTSCQQVAQKCFSFSSQQPLQLSFVHPARLCAMKNLCLIQSVVMDEWEKRKRQQKKKSFYQSDEKFFKSFFLASCRTINHFCIIKIYFKNFPLPPLFNILRKFHQQIFLLRAIEGDKRLTTNKKNEICVIKL